VVVEVRSCKLHVPISPHTMYIYISDICLLFLTATENGKWEMGTPGLVEWNWLNEVFDNTLT